MHVTSDYYRCREHKPVSEMGLAERWAYTVQKATLAAQRAEIMQKRLEAARSHETMPLRPSSHTLNNLARNYKTHKLHHVA